MRRLSVLLAGVRMRIVILLTALVVACSVPPVSAVTFPEATLSIKTASGTHGFTVELALTAEQRARGLMYRDTLAHDAGMLFDFGETRQVSMWMRNTFIPLDMLFIEADGRISRIEADTTPRSDAIISSGRPVRYVLELAAGVSAAIGVRPGDRVLFPRRD